MQAYIACPRGRGVLRTSPLRSSEKFARDTFLAHIGDASPLLTRVDCLVAERLAPARVSEKRKGETHHGGRGRGQAGLRAVLRGPKPRARRKRYRADGGDLVARLGRERHAPVRGSDGRMGGGRGLLGAGRPGVLRWAGSAG